MLKVLIVDDEPLILSGIKFMIDWEKNGCKLIGQARNGREALDLIASELPDIVVCDIAMPVMNGIELLREAQEKRSNAVFIMLSNLEEFGLAREALRLKAADYLVKTQLDGATLEKSIELAKGELEARGKLNRVDQAESLLKENEVKLLNSAVKKLASRNVLALSSADLSVLRESGVAGQFSAAILYFLTDCQENGGAFASDEEWKRLFPWEREVVDKIASKRFSKFLIFDDIKRFGLVLIYWGKDATLGAAQLTEFHQRLSAASKNVTGLVPCVLCAGSYSMDERREFLARLDALEQEFYLAGERLALPGAACRNELKHLPLTGMASRFRAELNSRSASGCQALFDKAIEMIEANVHEKAQAIWLCCEIQSAVDKALSRGDADGYEEAERILTREQALIWLNRVKTETLSLIEPLSSNRSELVEKAKSYVRDNIGKRILLQEAAHKACVSPSYLSSLFSKEEGQSFIDYVNQMKIAKAAEMIRQGDYRINEISGMLGYESPYYFSKVFRKQTGKSPTEYKRSLKEK
jgi:two-component system response regulator YesN